MKAALRVKQQGRCAVTGEALPEELPLFDKHRPVPRCKGGTYTKDNTVVVMPRAHFTVHDNLRLREEKMEELKAIVDDREQTRKLYQKIFNQLLAYKRRTDHLNPATITFLEEQQTRIGTELAHRDKVLSAFMDQVKDDIPLAACALKVDGIGPITVAYCLVYIDLTKADHASSLWAYVGLDKPQWARYEKGKKSGGCKKLRTVLYTMGLSQEKSRGAYRDVYDRVKERLSNSERIVKSKNTEGNWIECAWKDTKPCHRRGAALRAVAKHFLADYWFVGRTMLGLPTAPLYAEAVLGHGHKTVSPRERGWVF